MEIINFNKIDYLGVENIGNEKIEFLYNKNTKEISIHKGSRVILLTSIELIKKANNFIDVLQRDNII